MSPLYAIEYAVSYHCTDTCRGDPQGVSGILGAHSVRLWGGYVN